MATVAAVGSVLVVVGALGLALWLGGGPASRAGWEAAQWVAGIVAALALPVGVLSWAVRRSRIIPDYENQEASSQPRCAPEATDRADFNSSDQSIRNTIEGGISGSEVILARDVVFKSPQPQSNPTPPADEEIPISQVDPATLQVHQAVLPAPDPGNYAFLTPYLPRAHDEELRAHLASALDGGPSALVMMTGNSSTGKTRSLWEALYELTPHRKLLSPTTAKDLLQLLKGDQVDNQSVLWLNEAQRFFYSTEAAEIASVLYKSLNRQNGVVAVGTLWTTPYWDELVRPGVSEDPYAQVRELLTGPRTKRVPVPDKLSNNELEQWSKLARANSDQRMRDALNAGVVDRGRVIQHLSGGPELFQAYIRGPGHLFTPVEHALVTAAIDARRLGHRKPLPATLLAQAAEGDLHPRDRPTDGNWAHSALAALSTGKRCDSTRTDIRHTLTALYPFVPRAGAAACYDPSDYLDQHMRPQRIGQLGSPALWQALLEHTADADDLYAGLRT